MALGNIQIIKLLIGKWKHITIIALAAALAAIVVSMPVFMKPRYKSESTVYPTNLNPYSLESPTEQLLQLFQSRQLKQKLLRRFELWKAYNLDLKDPMFDFYYNQAFDEHIKFNQTKYETVMIEVFDHDPKMAREINAGILKALDEMVKQLHDEKTKEFRDMFAFEMSQKKKNVDSAERVLSELRTRYGILDYFLQAGAAKKSYYKALAKGKSPEALKALRDEMRLLEEKGGEYRKMDEIYRSELAEYEKVRKEYDEKVRDLNKKFSYTTIVTEPDIPVKKAWPVRWLIVVASVFSAVFLAALYYLVADRIRKILNQ